MDFSSKSVIFCSGFQSNVVQKNTDIWKMVDGRLVRNGTDLKAEKDAKKVLIQFFK